MKHLPHSENKMATMIWKSIAIVFVSFLFSPTLSAQDIIFEHSYEPSEFSTIRNYTENVDIKYEIRISPGYHKRFSYIDRSNGTVITFNINDYWSVSDFRILNGYVYFCGSDNGVAAFGWFNIDSVFFYNGDVHVMTLPSSIPNSLSPVHNEFIYNLNRMEISIIGDVVHLYMLGSGYADNFPAEIIADAWFSSTDGWKIEYTMDYSLKYHYGGITVTKKYIALIGLDKSSETQREHFVMSYIKQSTSTAGISMFRQSGGSLPPVSSYIITSTQNHTPYSIYNTMSTYLDIISVGKDSIVTMCGNYDTLQASLYAMPLHAPLYRIIVPLNHHYNMREMAYDTYRKIIGFIPRNSLNRVYEFHIPTHTLQSRSVQNKLWCSIDYNITQMTFSISGANYDYSTEMIWQHTPLSTSNCTEKRHHDIIEIDTDNDIRSELQIINGAQLYHILYPVKPISSNIPKICSD